MKIGVIGGSGLDDPQILQNPIIKTVTTPFGYPSSPLTTGTLAGKEIVIIARHGKGHTIMPTNVNNRANIWALKKEGCTHVVATTACGSLKEEIKPGDIIILDQFIDRTSKRHQTFYNDSFHGPDLVCHIPMADPFCPHLRSLLTTESLSLQLPTHTTGTVLTIEGPRFSTRAESKLFRSWNADVINMSIAPEAVLAREAGLCYAVIAMSTDYDCWKEESTVTWEEVLKVFKKNADNVKQIILKTLPSIVHTECTCMSAINTAIIGDTTLSTIKSAIRTIPDWPKPGIMFRDITTLLNDTKAFQLMMDILVHRYKDTNITTVAGIESRGFIIGAALADRLHLPFVPIRKKGKLPGHTISQEYTLEYGTDCIEIHSDAFIASKQVLLVDDLIATGGTVSAAVELVKKAGGHIQECLFIIDLPDIGGSAILKEKNIPYFALLQFEGE